MANLSRIHAADLPPLCQELVEVIGLPATIALVTYWGGIIVYVPTQVSVTHILARRLGFEAAQKLCAYAPGDKLTIPRCAEALRKARNRDVITRSKAGESAAKLARRYRITLRYVRNIRAIGTPPAPPQRTLF